MNLRKKIWTASIDDTAAPPPAAQETGSIADPSEEDEMSARGNLRGLEKAKKQRASLDLDEDEISERGIERGLDNALRYRKDASRDEEKA